VAILPHDGPTGTDSLEFGTLLILNWNISKSPKCTVIFVSHLHVLTKFGHHQKVHIFKREQLKFSISLLQVLTASVDQRLVFFKFLHHVVFKYSQSFRVDAEELMHSLRRQKTVNTNSLQKPKMRSQFEFPFKYLKSLMMTNLVGTVKSDVNNTWLLPRYECVLRWSDVDCVNLIHYLGTDCSSFFFSFHMYFAVLQFINCSGGCFLLLLLCQFPWISLLVIFHSLWHVFCICIKYSLV
jgi:hypothetical protein